MSDTPTTESDAPVTDDHNSQIAGDYGPTRGPAALAGAGR